MLPSLISFLSRTQCFLCGGGDNPSVVCPACLQVHSLNDDLRDFVLALTEEEMEQTAARWARIEDWYGCE